MRQRDYYLKMWGLNAATKLHFGNISPKIHRSLYVFPEKTFSKLKDQIDHFLLFELNNLIILHAAPGTGKSTAVQFFENDRIQSLKHPTKIVTLQNRGRHEDGSIVYSAADYISLFNEINEFFLFLITQSSIDDSIIQSNLLTLNAKFKKTIADIENIHDLSSQYNQILEEQKIDEIKSIAKQHFVRHVATTIDLHTKQGRLKRGVLFVDEVDHLNVFDQQAIFHILGEYAEQSINPTIVVSGRPYAAGLAKKVSRNTESAIQNDVSLEPVMASRIIRRRIEFSRTRGEHVYPFSIEAEDTFDRYWSSNYKQALEVASKLVGFPDRYNDHITRGVIEASAVEKCLTEERLLIDIFKRSEKLRIPHRYLILRCLGENPCIRFGKPFFQAYTTLLNRIRPTSPIDQSRLSVAKFRHLFTELRKGHYIRRTHFPEHFQDSKRITRQHLGQVEGFGFKLTYRGLELLKAAKCKWYRDGSSFDSNQFPFRQDCDDFAIPPEYDASSEMFENLLEEDYNE